MGRQSVARRIDDDDRDVRPPEHPTASATMVDAGPGWYYDPDDRAVYRYWDGAGWTDHRSEIFRSEQP